MGGSKLVVRVHGTWGARRGAPTRPLLVVDAGDRRHRFPATEASRPARAAEHDAWSAAFVVPMWLGSSLDGNMSLSFGGSSDGIMLPPLSDEPSSRTSPDRLRSTNGRAKVKLRPISENGKARRESRVSELARLNAMNVGLRRELERMTELANRERAERDKYHNTSVVLARKVADMFAERAAALAARDQLTEECARLAEELARVRSELAPASELAATLGPVSEPVRLASVN
jgi:hypothetical protein